MGNSKYNNIVISAEKNPELTRFLYNLLIQVRSGAREARAVAEYLTQMIEVAVTQGSSKSLTSMDFTRIPSENAPKPNESNMGITPITDKYPSLKKYLLDK